MLLAMVKEIKLVFPSTWPMAKRIVSEMCF